MVVKVTGQSEGSWVRAFSRRRLARYVLDDLGSVSLSQVLGARARIYTMDLADDERAEISIWLDLNVWT